MSSNTISKQITEVLLAIASSETGRISRAVLEDHFARVAGAVLGSGLLEPDGDLTVTSVMSNEGEAPVALLWWPETSSFGYFDSSVGWIAVDPQRMESFRLNVPLFADRLLAPLERVGGANQVELVPGYIWEAGTYRLPQRKTPVPIWIARCLASPSGEKLFVAAARRRPSPGLRLVINLGDQIAAKLPRAPGHEIVDVLSVMDSSDGAMIDANILSTLLAHGPDVTGPVHMSAEGGSITVHGETHLFSGGKQRAVVRILLEAWQAGSPTCLTDAVLTTVEAGDSVRRLSELFKGHPTWKEIIREKAGRCWLVV